MAKRNYERAVAALMASPTAKEAARTAGIGESTLRSYRSDPEFMELYTAARHELIDEGVKSIQEKFSEAVETVCQVMRDEGTPPQRPPQRGQLHHPELRAPHRRDGAHGARREGPQAQRGSSR